MSQNLIVGLSSSERKSSEEDLYRPIDSGGLQTGSLTRYIQTVIIDGEQPVESECHLLARRTLQVVAPLLACAAKLSFIALSTAAAGSNKVLGAFLSYGNITAFSIIISWCALNMISDLMSPRVDAEKTLEKAQLPSWVNTGIAVSSCVLGVFAQFSLAYLVYVYNNNNILMPIAVMVSDPWFPVYSTWCGLSKLAKQRSYSPIEKEIAAVKQDHIVGLQRAQRELSLIEVGQRNILRSNLNRLSLEAKSVDRVGEYNNSMLSRKVEVIRQPSCIYKVAEKVIFAVGVVLLLSQYLVIIYTGFAGWKLVWDQKVFDGFMTAITFGAYFYIAGMTIPNGAVRLFSLISGLLCCKHEPSLAQRSAPFPAVLLTLLTLFTTFLSWGPNKEVAEDYFNGWLQTAMLATAPAAVVLLTTFIVLLVADIALEQYVARFSDTDTRDNMKLKWKYDDYIRILDKCSIPAYAKFLKEMPLTSLGAISGSASELVGRLSVYVSSNERTNLLVQNQELFV